MNKTEKLKAIMCDLDGTLALMGERSPYDASTCEMDELNFPIADILNHYKDDEGMHIILVSGREDTYRLQTERWLKKHNITYENLYMRRKGDFRKDAIIKNEIYKKYIEDKYDVLFILEDRDQMVELWRSKGLTCLQVEYGNF
ncbi:MAG TPA: hypothetical protein VK338_03575 [Candidatus Nitrosocosmicus sp.]|nr:hypothetical protein [Candidatus Nitrosocosmicus sp.]